MIEKDFLSLERLTRDELEELFLITDVLRRDSIYQPLKGKSAALIFQKPSLRTRVSFEVGVCQLGGHPIFLSQEGVGIGTREKASDVARLLSRFTQLIVARLYDHEILLELAEYASVPVINALTDLSHPCQILADMYTLRQHGRLAPGIKIVFVGDGNNVVRSWLEMACIFPMRFVLAAPRGYDPDPAILRKVRQSTESTVEIVRRAEEAVAGADVVYTDVWTSMGQEKEMAARKKTFAKFKVTKSLMALAKFDCLFMHCLPAHRGEEVTEEVLEGGQSIVFDEAENRLHVQKAVMARLLGFRYSGAGRATTLRHVAGAGGKR